MIFHLAQHQPQGRHWHHSRQLSVDILCLECVDILCLECVDILYLDCDDSKLDDLTPVILYMVMVS